MNTREKLIKLILDNLYNTSQISEQQQTALYNNYTSNSDLNLVVKEQGDSTDSKAINKMVFDSVIDIATIFDSLNTADDMLTRHQKLNEAIINSIKLDSNKLDDKIIEYEQRIKNNNRFIRYEAFRDISGIDQDITKYDESMAYFDKYLEAIKLHYISSTNLLVSKTGARLGDIKITRQHGSSLSTIKNAETSVEKAIDTDMSTYWHECITIDSPIEIQYDDVKRGAVCELLITFNLISEINEITLTPFGSFPLDIVKISVSNNDTGDFTPVVFSSNNNEYQRSKSSKDTMSYQFADTKVKRIKLLLNQVHYVYNNFVGKVENMKANGIFITDNKAELANSILEPVERAIVNSTFIIPFEKETFHTDKLQYEYGLYNILIAKNEFETTSQIITTPSTVLKTSEMILVTDEEQFKDGDVIATSIEYVLSGNSVPNGLYPILPNGTTAVNWEFLDIITDPITNKIKAELRFPSNMSTIKIYCDDVLMNNDYIVNNETEIEFVEFNPYANYCASYDLKNPIAATQCTLIADGNLVLEILLRQNSRLHTGVTPILNNYTVIAKNLLLQAGQDNQLFSITIVPDRIQIDGNEKVAMGVQDEVILMSLKPNMSSVFLNMNETISIDNYYGSMEGDR